MISVGFKNVLNVQNVEYVFKTFRELEIFMGERGYTKHDIDWMEEVEP